jgi:hypothetical protein
MCRIPLKGKVFWAFSQAVIHPLSRGVQGVVPTPPVSRGGRDGPERLAHEVEFCYLGLGICESSEQHDLQFPGDWYACCMSRRDGCLRQVLT